MTQPVLKSVPTAARASKLSAVKKGKIALPLRILGFGPEGVGKSTFAAGAPSPIFLGAEDGTNELDIARYQPETFDEAIEFIDDLARDTHDYKTIVVDPVNWLEPLVYAKIVGTSGKSIDDFGGGFQKGYTAALDQWRVLLAALERVWRRDMHVILLAHSAVKSFNDPEGPAYDRYEVAMYPKSAGLIRQWVDFVLFMRRESFSKLDERTKKAKGFSTGKRIIHTQWTAAFDAKSRVRLPDEIPLSWDEFYGAVAHGRANIDEIKREIARLIEVIGDAEVTKKATGYVAAAGDDAGKLSEIANALAMKANEGESK